MTPLEEQVEKLAGLLSARYSEHPTSDYGSGDKLWDANWEKDARKILAALLPLEVTDEMVEAGARALCQDGGGVWDTELGEWRGHYRKRSRACLSAALTQPQTEKQKICLDCGCQWKAPVYRCPEEHKHRDGLDQNATRGINVSLTQAEAEAMIGENYWYADSHTAQEKIRKALASLLGGKA